MGQDIPTLKLELPMALPNEPQAELDGASRKLYEDSKNSVFKIVTDKERPGSGFLVDDGSRIVTSARNVSKSSEQFAIGNDGKRYKLEIEKLSDLADIAILKIKNGSIPGAKPLQIGNMEALEPDSKLWTISHPKEANSSQPYISPGYARGLSTPMEFLAGMDKNVVQAMAMKVRGMDMISQAEISAYMMQPLLDSKIHIEQGSVGSPILDEHGKVVSVTVLSNGKDLSRGQTLAAPAESITELLEGKGRLSYSYKAAGADWAEQYKANWQTDKTKALLDTGVVGLMSGAGYAAANKFPLLASAGIGGYGLMKLSSDAGHYLASTDNTDGWKYGLATASDLGTVGGAVASLIPKMRGYGLAVAGLGLAGRAACDFIKNRWVVDSSQRVESEEDKRPAFNLDEFLKR